MPRHPAARIAQLDKQNKRLEQALADSQKRVSKALKYRKDALAEVSRLQGLVLNACERFPADLDDIRTKLDSGKS